MGMIAPTPRVMFRNLVDQAVSLAASSAADGYPVLALQDPQPTVRWKSTSAAAQQITATWALPVAATCLILHNHNLTYRGQVSVISGGVRQDYPAWEPIHPFGQTPFGQTPVGGYPAPAYMRGLAGGHTRIIYLTTPILTNQAVFELTDADNPDGYLAVGRIFLGPMMQSPKVFISDHALDWQDKSEVTELDGGQDMSVLRKRVRSLDITFERLPEPFALGALSDFLAQVGNSVPFFFDPFPFGPGQRRQRYGMYCRRSADSEGLSMDGFFRGGTNLVLIEKL
jgi:hypothetical protein